MKIVIDEIYEEKNVLRVVVSHPYGTDNLGLSLESKALDPNTNRPRFLSQVKKLIEMKYGKSIKDTSTQKKNVYVDIVGKEVDLESFEELISPVITEDVSVHKVNRDENVE